MLTGKTIFFHNTDFNVLFLQRNPSAHKMK